MERQIAQAAALLEALEPAIRKRELLVLWHVKLLVELAGHGADKVSGQAVEALLFHLIDPEGTSTSNCGLRT